MRIGVCANPVQVRLLPGEAFDFLEVNVQSFLLPEKEEEAFMPALEAASALPFSLEAANCFLPPDIKCIGVHRDLARLQSYAEVAFRRAAAAEISQIVFGSGKARELPPGVSRPEGLRQFVEVLALLAPIAEAHEITVAVEPLNREESNFINSLAEGAAAVEAVDHPRVRLMADLYHMAREGEPPRELARYGHLLSHIHIAEKEGRTSPGKHGDDFSPYFSALRKAGYDCRISVECEWHDLPSEADRTCRWLREHLTPEYQNLDHPESA